MLAYYIIASVLILSAFVPFINHPHWFFRTITFGKVQFLTLQIICFILGCLFIEMTVKVYILQALLLLIIIYNSSVIVKYTSFYPSAKPNASMDGYKRITFITANVYQYNKDYTRFIKLIEKESPDLIFTVETNKEWEEAMEVLETEYPHYYKVPLENTYGMHFYSKLKIKHVHEHYFVSDDIPSLEVDIETNNGKQFCFFGVHPPPPSPTEEKTSEERDGELISIAKRISENDKQYIVAGDFNDVVWAKLLHYLKRLRA